MVKDEYYVLSNGVKIPKIGLGTWQVKDGEEAYNSVMYALKAGYRHIDTAYAYGNENSVIRAIKDFNIPREEVFITTKLPAEAKSYNLAMEYFNRSLYNLETEYIDLYLIHAPWPWDNVGGDYSRENTEAWKAMVKLYEAERIRAIGVSNFREENIKPLIDATGFIPHVNQIRFFIGNTQEPVYNYCKDNNILVQAYSPMATGGLLKDEKIIKMAEKYNTTVPKLCINYCLERQTQPLPKSINEGRIMDNLDVNFSISGEDMEYLNSIKAPEELKRPYRS